MATGTKMTEGIIEFSDFAKVDLRVGEIVDVEEIEGADKLWKLRVDLNEDLKRTICAGLKPYYSEDDLIGKKIIVVVNLAPRKMRGIESQGMLLAASDEEKKNVVLVSPEKNIENGARVS